jgi:YVTN family beta-propeller protein
MLRFRAIALLTAVIVLLCPGLASAQTVLNFPRVVSNSSLFTGLGVSNPTSAGASVTFTAFFPDGTQLTASGLQNPITLQIPAGGQAAKLFTDIFGSRDFNGWVQATSSTKGLAGFFLNGTTNQTDLDGAGAVDPSAEFILPFASEDATGKTEITILNVNADPATATLTLYGPGGAVLASQAVSLPARGLMRQTLSGIFANTDLTTASHVRVKSDRAVIGHELVANYALAGIPVRRETAALSGQRLSASTAYVLPQFVNGGGWLSLIGIVNGGGVGQEVTLTAYKEEGTLWNVPNNPKRVSLDGNAALRTTASELFALPADAPASGWIQVDSTLGYISSYIAYGNTTTPSFAAVAGQDTTTASRFEVFSQVAQGIGFFTGLTVVNAGTQDVSLEFYTLRPDGTTVGKSTVTIKAKQRVGKLFSELLPGSLSQVGGWAFVRASQPVIGAVLFGTMSGYALASVPQQLPAGDFLPPAQATGAIDGTVRSAGHPVGGVQLTLSGPVTAATTTDANGQYIFPQLPADTYTVTAVQAGAQFVPPSQTKTVNLQNIDGVDFASSGLTSSDAPSIQFLAPSATIAGSGAFNIQVLGSNFTPQSIIQVNGQPVLTAFVSSVELQAIVPADTLTAPRTLQITVSTPPPGGGVSPAVALTVNALSGDPLMEGRVAVGSFPAGVAIDTTRGTALVTNQSSDSVTVLDLKSLTIEATVSVGRSPAEGIAIDAAKNIALVANPGSNNVSVIDLNQSRETQKIVVGRFPVSIAVNPVTQRAAITNADDDSVNIVDLNTLTVVGRIPVGTRPQGVAINAVTNQALVTNSASNDAWLIDLNTNGLIAKIGTGQFPRGVAISSITNIAVVANANSDDVTAIDLNARTVLYTVKVGIGPTGVAIHELTNEALITNSGIVRASTDFSGASTVSVLDIATRTINRTIPVGSAAFGVGVHQDAQEAVVANFGSNDATLFRIPNPIPHVTSVSPNTFPAGGGGFTITVSGTGFVQTSVVTLNNVPLSTTFVSFTQLKATVSDTLQPVDFNVSVTNDGPGGGNAIVDPGAGSLTPHNMPPVLLSIAPTQVNAGSASLTLSLSGNNLNATSIVNFGGLQLSPLTANGTSMTATIPAGSLTTAGSVAVTVTNPGAGTTTAQTFTINPQGNKAPAITNVNPTSIPAGSGAATVTVQGAGFTASSIATLGSINGSVSGNTATFNLSASDTQNPTTLNGLISNAGGTASFSVNILNVIPTVSGFTPTGANAGSPSLPITVTGTNFNTTSQITVQGTPIPTQLTSSTRLTGTIPDTFLRRSGNVTIGVTNTPPGGGSASGGTFTISSLVPTLTGVNPNTTPVLPVPVDVAIQLTGDGFTGNSQVNAGATALAAVFNSQTSLMATIPASLLQQSGTFSITVTNPAPGGGTSGAVSFTVLNPVPALTSVTPNQLQGDQTNVVLTLAGQNFVKNSTVQVGTLTLTPASISATQIQVPLPSPLPLGTLTVTVTNPGPGGGVSNSILINITSLQPTIRSVTPNPVGAGQTITVIGTNFGSGSTVLVRGLPIPTATTSTTSLTATIPATTTTGAADVIVRNPATVSTAALDSTPFPIQIVNPVPAISSLTPPSAPAGTTVTINGSGFIPVSQVTFNGAPITASFGDGSTLTFVVPGNAAPGQLPVQVTNGAPGGGTSNAVLLTVISPTPSVTAVLPASGQADRSVSLTVTGSNFVPGAAILFNSVNVGGTFVNSNTMTAFVSLPASLSGQVPVGVVNPGGVVSNVVGFTVIAEPSGGNNPAPTVSSLSPSSLPVGSPTSSLTITGTGFIASSTVTFGATGVAVLAQTATSLVVNIPASSLTTAGEVAVNVTNPAPGGGSGSRSFTILSSNPVPTITSLSPSSVLAGAPATTLTITGTNFIAASTVNFGATLLAIQSQTATQLVVIVPATSLTTLGPVTVTVTNPAPGGGSANQQFTILSSNPVPTITSLSPSSVVAGAPATTLTITGTNFIAASIVSFGTTPLAIQSQTATQLVVIVPETSLTTAGPVTVTVTNPPPGGGSANQQFTIEPAIAPPTLSALSPSSGIQGTVVPVTITGSNFITGGTTVNVSGGTGVIVSSVTVSSTTSLVAVFELSGPTGSYGITATTSAGTSNALAFRVSPNTISSASQFE